MKKIFKPFSGRRLFVWLILAACFFLGVPIAAVAAKTELLHTSPKTNLKYYQSYSQTTNGVKYTFTGWGTHDPRGDFDPYFSPVNFSVSVNKPFIEYKFISYDSDVGNKDIAYENMLYVQYEGQTDWVRVARSERQSYDIKAADASNYGVVVRMREDDAQNDSEHETWRYYPTDLTRKIAKIRHVSHFDTGGGGGDCLPAGSSREVDGIWVYEAPVTFDFSDLDGKVTFTEGAGGKVAYTLKDVPTYGVVSLKSSWKKNKHDPLTDKTDQTWTNEGLNFRMVDGSGATISKSADKVNWTDSGGKASVSGTLTGAKYDISRNYITHYVLQRKITVNTNGYEVNREHTITQKLVYESKANSSNLKAIASPTDVSATSDMWNKKMEIAWKHSNSNADKSGKWYVFRYKKGDTSTRVLLTASGLAESTLRYQDGDADLVYDTDYVYEVSFFPNSFGTISVPETSLCKSVTAQVERKFPMTLSAEALVESGTGNGIRLTWTNIPVLDNNVKFKVWRREYPMDADGRPIINQTNEKINYEEIKEMPTQHRDSMCNSYHDDKISNPCILYQYKVTAEVKGKTFESETVFCSIAGGSIVTSVTATKGTHSKSVQVQWTVRQVGTSPTRFDVSRRVLGSEGAFSRIYTTEGTASRYQYEDNNVQPGNYYEYKVEAFSLCGSGAEGETAGFKLSNSMSADGFGQSTGIISGRITYGTGTAVEGVKVVLTRSNDEYNTKNQFYALESKSSHPAVSYNMDETFVKSLFENGDTATFQMWLNLSTLCSDPTIIRTRWFKFYADLTSDQTTFTLKYHAYPTGSGNGASVGSAILTGNIGMSVPANSYAHVTLEVSKNHVCVRTIDPEGEMRKWESNLSSPIIDEETLGDGQLYIGGEDRLSDQFFGLIDEVRVWSRGLTDAEVLGNYNRLLAGTENGLEIYWPMDEGINGQATAYDYSKTGGVPNERHGTISTDADVSGTVPSADQLSLYGLTDADGNYTIRGVPFSGEGTNYIATPIMGVHEFSPKYQTRYVSANSLTHSGTDMEDVSSFEVSGTVYYENTLFPVEGAYLYVDGVVANRDGKAIMTDEDGNYTISVPIGDHFVSVQKPGHTFVGEGRYPADPDNVGVRHTFEKEMSNLMFFDNTLVTVAGRVNGGEKEGTKPFGTGLGKNTIGKATVKLSTAAKKPLNVVLETNGLSSSYQPNAQNRDMEVDKKSPNSGSGYYQGGNMQETASLFIQTDSVTGEFAVLLPPLMYTVESVTVNNNPGITFSGLPDIDATNPQMVYTDSLEVDGDLIKFDYHASMNATYRVSPTFNVTDTGADEGAFGEKTVTVKERLATGPGDDVEIPIYTVENGAVNYLHGRPVFQQSGTYKFQFEGYEEYVNHDDEQPEFTRVPLAETVVTIKNELSSEQCVRAADDMSDAAAVVDLKENQLALDSLGMAEYTFAVGFPNTLADQNFARALHITYNVNGQENDWDNNGRGVFEGVILGALPTGTNFVTAGPTKVDMVLRDPPGGNSYATWTKGTSKSSKTSNAGTWTSEEKWESIFKAGVKSSVINGTVTFGVITETEFKHEHVAGVKLATQGDAGNSYTTTVTLTDDISTSDSPEYVGADGDIFIGHSSNLLFGDAHSVTFIKNPDTGVYSLGSETAKITSEQFSTMFQYTQYYVKNTLIPNLRSLRDNMIRTVSQSEYNDKNLKTQNEYPVYISTLAAGDKDFGRSDTDQTKQTYRMILPSNPPQNYCYQDSVLWYNNQIEGWEKVLASNEKAKVEAIENRSDAEWLKGNYSFDAGTTITKSEEMGSISTSFVNSDLNLAATYRLHFGTTIGETTGVLNEIGTETGAGWHHEGEDSTEDTECFSYTLSASGNSALTVDVYDAHDGFSPVFVTRGGQTADPYEGETLTEYYRPGTSISAATMQIEVPEITVVNPSATNVPAGNPATFTLKLVNRSEVNEDAWFVLALDDQSNTNGAKLSIDGAVLTDGRAFLLKAGETLYKTLLLEQTDQSVLDFEDIRLVLKSQSQGDPASVRGAIADTVAISAFFVPSCSNISLRADATTINTATTPAGTLKLHVSDIDRGYRSFKGFRVEYKYANDPDWKTFRTYVMDANDPMINGGNYQALPNEGVIDVNVDMSNNNYYPDGQYVFRAVTMCDFGTGEVTNESGEIAVIRDMARPQILGTPNPADGILNAGDDIYVTFNEDIRNGALARDINFIVTGVLNGAQVSHNTTMQLNGAATAAASTEADIMLDRQSFATDFWMNISGEGTLIEHGAGANKFRMGVTADNKLTVEIAGQQYVSQNAVPQGKWAFLSLSYDYAKGASLLNAQVATDDQTISLFRNYPVADYTGSGRLSVGAGMTGNIHELTLWNRARTLTESQGEMYVTKTPSTPNLIGYWKMDEGHGASVRDYARNRHMTSAGNWALNNENLSAAFNGTSSYAELDITGCNTRSGDSYALELWFKGEPQTNATLFSVSTDKLALRANAAGQLALVVDGQEKRLGTADYLDSQWHHFALNVLRSSQGLGQVYIDGVNVAQYPATDVPSLEGNAISLGALRSFIDNHYERSEFFKGEMDEVRLWNAALTSSVLDENRYSRVDTATVAGLVAYYPFETRYLDGNLQVVTAFSLDDMSRNKVTSKEAYATTQGATAPGLKEAPAATNLQFTFTASERQVFLTLNESAARLEGTTVNITLRDVLDLNNNSMNTVTWTAFVSQNRLKWSESEVSVERVLDDAPNTFSVSVSNTGSTDEQWTVTNLPSWLSVSSDKGSVRPLSETRLNFTVSDATPAGRYEETVYLSGNDGIYEPLVVSLKVTAGKPKWAVTPADYELSMNMVGQLHVDGLVTGDSDDILAAFVGDECVGMASPIYYPRYDAYYVHLTVYGNEEHLDKPVTFKMWDASMGDTYPQVSVSEDVKFYNNLLTGSMDNPFIWNAKEQREQALNLTKGWNWLSLYVNPEDNETTLDDIFGDNSDSFVTIKNASAFSSPSETGWQGVIGDMEVGQLYKVQTNKALEMSVYGRAINAADHEVTIANGWNWIGFNSSSRMTIDDAFAGVSPKKGDLVKSQTAFSVYEDYQWVGTLGVMVPGQGYMYCSVDDATRTFTYPSASLGNVTNGTSLGWDLLTARFGAINPQYAPEFFQPVSEHKYPGTMTMIAKVVKNGVERADVEVAAFVGDECRGAIKALDNGLVFLSIFGETLNEPVEIKVFVDGEEITVDKTYPYVEDDNYGTVAEPEILSLDIVPTGANILFFVEGETSVYTLQGYYVGTSLRTLEDGLYIVNGQKVNVKNGRIVGSTAR